MKTKLAFLRNKNILLLGLFAVGLVFVPIDVVHAGLVSTIVNALVNSVGVVFVMTLGIIASIVALIFGVLANILIVFIEYFLNSTVTPGRPNTPEFVAASFNFVLQFVNMFFILILVFIGLATILRLETYGIKKTLPKLIIVALLVNFSGIFVGFIVDISNLFANFFLQQSAGSWGNVGDAVSLLSPEGSVAQKIGIQVASIIYYLVAIFIYLVLIVLFAVRTMFLWLLVILAPLAFASYILPATKSKIWDVWLSQLIQWSIFAIPVTFFMFLAHNVLTAGGFSFIDVTEGSAINFLRDLLAPLTALLILYVGVTTSQQMAPAAVKGMTKLATKAIAFGGKRVFSKLRERTSDRVGKAGEKLNASADPEWGSTQEGLRGFSKRRVAKAWGFAKRNTGRAIKAGTIDADKKEAREARARAKESDVTGNLGRLRDATTNTERAGIIAAMVEENQMRDALEPDIVGKNNVLKQDEAFEAYKKAGVLGDKKTQEGIERSFVGKKDTRDEKNNLPLADQRPFVNRLAESIDEATKNAGESKDRTQNGLDKRDRDERGFTSYPEKIIANAMSADDIKQLHKGWWGDEGLMEAVHKFWGGNQLQQAAINFGRDFMNALESSKKDADWYYKVGKVGSGKNAISRPRNTAIPQYFASNGAQSLGLSVIDGASSRPEINMRVSIANAIAQAPKLGDGASILHGIQDLRQELEKAKLDKNDAKNNGQNTANIDSIIDNITKNVIPTAEKDLATWVTSNVTGKTEAESWNNLVDTIMRVKMGVPKGKKEDVNKYKTV